MTRAGTRLHGVPSLVREVLRVLALAAVVEWRLRRTPIRSLAAGMGVPLADDGRPKAEPAGVLPGWAELRLRSVDIAFKIWRFGAAGDCLRRSLVTGHLLRELGPVLRLGVRRDGAQVRAHAWIEVRGVAIDSDPSGYVPLEARDAP
ncbi:MAG: lasso peptide biosynthesis B2 protein [Actinomycetota bacterium]